MKEIREIIKAYKQIDFKLHKAALVTVVGLQGSSYRRKGARMLVLDNGTYLGGISGGCLEGDALKRANMAILKDRPSIVTYDTTQQDDAQIGVGLGCNGIIDILFMPLDPNDLSNPVNILDSIQHTREPKILINLIKIGNEVSGQTFLYKNDHQITQEINIPHIENKLLNDIKLALHEIKSRTIKYTHDQDDITIFIEAVIPETRLIIYGSNADINPITFIAKQLGWEIILITNVLKASKLLVEKVDLLLDIKNYSLPVTDHFMACVLMTHDYKTDLDNLGNILKTNVSYIGMLGPKSRAERLFTELKASNHLTALLSEDRIFAPAGLDIGATTPEEIALSIVAEIKANFANRHGGFLKKRKGTINEN